MARRATAPGEGPVGSGSADPDVSFADELRNTARPLPRLLLSSSATQRLKVPETIVSVDVYLDKGLSTGLPTWTAPHRPAEGVHALVWHHGEPLGDLTLVGDPSEILPELPQVAAKYLRRAVLEHQLRDALSHRWDIAHLSIADLLATEHPEQPPVDASQVTVAVCTRDRAGQLRDCLTSIGALRSRVSEVLVLDNASHDGGTRDVAAEFPFVRYVREPRIGLDWARNRALLEAQTDIVAFTDDDAIVHDGWVEGLLRAFADEPDAVAVGGLVVAAELMTPAQIIFERPGGFSRGYRRQWFATAVGAGKVAAAEHPGMGKAGTGANIAVRRRVALELGGFDTALDVGTVTGGGGDVEFLFRAVAAGHLVVYEPTAVVRHRHRRTMEELARQKRGDGTGTYSIYLGAARHYGRLQRRAFRRVAARWAVRHLGVGYLRSVFAPSLWPRSLVVAEIRGAVSATAGGYYRRAQREAAREAARYPDQPSAPALLRSPVRARAGIGSPSAHLAIDLAAATPPSVPEAGPAVIGVEVFCDGRAESDFTVDTGGHRTTHDRLLRELAAHLNDRADPSVPVKSRFARFRASLAP